LPFSADAPPKPHLKTLEGGGVVTHALVTGCAGFIGATLCQRLLQEGFTVTGIDAMIANYEPWMKRRNLSFLLKQKNFRFIPGNLINMDLLPVLAGVDYVFHQAGMPGVRTSWGSEFTLYTENNILATQRLLEAVSRSSIKKLIYASSSSIYGSMNGPTTEEQKPAPVSPYGITKLSAEHLCQVYHVNFGVPTIALRYFTVYGPKQRPDMAFHRFIRRILTDQVIAIYGDGRQTRDFTYVDDAVEANLLAMRASHLGRVYNIGGQHPIPLLDVIRIIEKQTGKKAITQFFPEQKGDPKHTWADINLAKRELNYTPSFDLEAGIRMQVDDIRRLYRL
jgi:UDP-glucose 4-epimerase